MWLKVLSLACVLIVSICKADVYLHNPRGSNNRLDERGRGRANGNRLFDSQNNNRGGYNVGSLYYYPGSILPIEWTNQHSCGEANSHCELILQYMCSADVRDGTRTTTIPLKSKDCDGYNCNRDLEYGMHEDHDYYLHCRYRERNTNLFTADQNMKNRKTAINTRQNPAGTRRGYECPEERDYYPYWGPSPWKDIAVMTNDVDKCNMYQKESANVKSRWMCKPPTGYLRARLLNKIRTNLPNEKEACQKIVYNKQNATWVEVKAHGIPPPECLFSPRSRDNHNGNGPGGFTNKYQWTIPVDVNENCALRLRYNISTGDYAANLSSLYNKNTPRKVDIAQLVGLPENEALQRGYVFKGNPVVQPLNKTFNGKTLKLKLAINTAQFGRTFQDRSHSFQIRARPSNMDADTRIHNLNVRGKRGNIVQNYPAVEYDFVPNRMDMNVDEYIHFQWTGSNTNPDNNDGQGLRGSDRSNIMVLRPEAYPAGNPNLPYPADQKHGHFGRNFPEHLNSGKFLGLSREDRMNLAILLPGQFKGELSELDDAGTYFDMKPRKITREGKGTYHYVCTRNNNFSNRGQKGRIIVNSIPKVAALMGWSGGDITMGDGHDGITIEKGAAKSPVKITISRYESEEGEVLLQQNGGSMDEGSGYQSKYFMVQPFEKLLDEDQVTIKMKVDSSSAKLFHSTDYKSWQKVDDVTFDDGYATFQSQKGGLFVARTDNFKRNLVIGIVVAVVIIAILVLGVTVYFRRNPESWAQTKRGFNEIKMSSKSQI